MFVFTQDFSLKNLRKYLLYAVHLRMFSEYTHTALRTTGGLGEGGEILAQKPKYLQIPK